MHEAPHAAGDQSIADFTQDMVYDLFDVDFDKQSIPRYRTLLRQDASPEIREVLYPGGGGTPFPRPCPPPTFAPFVEMPQ